MEAMEAGSGGGDVRGRARGASRRAGAVAALAAPALLVGASCSREAPPPAALDAGRVASVVVGRSSRADVFAALGRPGRTERSARGEAWVYEAGQGGAGGQNLVGGVAAASGVVGAFVPYAGLVGSGLGLANAVAGGTRPRPEAASLAVAFGGDGVVRDCVYASTASPAGLPGSAATAAGAVDCRRPPPGAVPGPVKGAQANPGR